MWINRVLNVHILIHTCVFKQRTYKARTDPYCICLLENTVDFGCAAMGPQGQKPYGLEPETGVFVLSHLITVNTLIYIFLFRISYFFLFCTLTNKCTQLFHNLSHCYMFRHYRVILRQLVINTLPSYTSISNAAFGNTV
jgi:hypothetical protein